MSPSVVIFAVFPQIFIVSSLFSNHSFHFVLSALNSLQSTMSLTPPRFQSMNAVIEAECPACSSQMIAPTAIPAGGHKFCFTCLKGVCMNGMGCPMCRGPIDPSIFSLPSQVLDLKMDVPLSPVVVQDKCKFLLKSPFKKHEKRSISDTPIANRDTSPSETHAHSALDLDGWLQKFLSKKSKNRIFQPPSSMTTCQKRRCTGCIEGRIKDGGDSIPATRETSIKLTITTRIIVK